MTDSLTAYIVYIGYGSLLLSFLPILIIITIGFRYVLLIEERVSKGSGGISTARTLWKGRVVGRFMRSGNVFAYLLFRSLPSKFFSRKAALLGDPDIDLPASWQAWVLLPGFMLCAFVAIAVIANALL